VHHLQAPQVATTLNQLALLDDAQVVLDRIVAVCLLQPGDDRRG